METFFPYADSHFNEHWVSVTAIWMQAPKIPFVHLLRFRRVFVTKPSAGARYFYQWSELALTKTRWTYSAVLASQNFTETYIWTHITNFNTCPICSKSLTGNKWLSIVKLLCRKYDMDGDFMTWAIQRGRGKYWREMVAIYDREKVYRGTKAFIWWYLCTFESDGYHVCQNGAQATTQKVTVKTNPSLKLWYLCTNAINIVFAVYRAQRIAVYCYYRICNTNTL